MSIEVSVMPYKRHDPVPESEMDRDRWQGHHSICQFLRDMYHETDDSNLKLKIRVCMAMAKAMNKKLQEYKHAEEDRQKQKLGGLKDGEDKMDLHLREAENQVGGLGREEH